MRRTGRSRGLSADTAILVALFLVVQALFSGLATGARANSADSGTTILCGSDRSMRGGAADPLADRSHLIDCCTFGCPMLGGALPPPVLPALPCHVAGSQAILIPAASAQLTLRAELAPLRSRAPPKA